jgi:predicted aspartyl protease
MITGIVKFDEAHIRIKVKGPAGSRREITAVIDTGFTSSLTLPPATIALLGLRWQSVDRGTLADGSECLFDSVRSSSTMGWQTASHPCRRSRH